MPALNFASKLGGASVAGAAGNGSAFTTRSGVAEVGVSACWFKDGACCASAPADQMTVATNASPRAVAGRATLSANFRLFVFLIDPPRDRFFQTAHANARIGDGRPF